MNEIVTNEKVLKIKSEPIKDLEIADVVQQLVSSIPQGALGLAAPQIGIHKRAFIANLQSGSYVFVNPVFTWTSPDKTPSIESCLSIPGVSRCVKRHNQVDINCDRIINLSEATSKVDPSPMRLKGLDAFIVQHELDHLNGVLITDHEESLTREQQAAQRLKNREEKLNKKREENKGIITSLSTPKTATRNLRKLAKLQKQNKIMKRQNRTLRRQEKIRVETQERYMAEQKGLFESPSDMPENPQ